ncbi:unnamed protein product [Parascedosporium putredinis]|uniref:Uncharacterized protein n=1 Tax=Parascedosporium putredinis TaxID=1442378 RepID=A0A9P1GXY8_9PEZI|nr:unnamed protein product [Parascedosporium putredinis]CAI7991123.1 unnamed protein product [Parascedosporium putredinis]
MPCAGSALPFTHLGNMDIDDSRYLLQLARRGGVSLPQGPGDWSILHVRPSSPSAFSFSSAAFAPSAPALGSPPTARDANVPLQTYSSPPPPPPSDRDAGDGLSYFSRPYAGDSQLSRAGPLSSPIHEAVSTQQQPTPMTSPRSHHHQHHQHHHHDSASANGPCTPGSAHRFSHNAPSSPSTQQQQQQQQQQRAAYPPPPPYAGEPTRSYPQSHQPQNHPARPQSHSPGHRHPGRGPRTTSRATRGRYPPKPRSIDGADSLRASVTEPRPRQGLRRRTAATGTADRFRG